MTTVVRPSPSLVEAIAIELATIADESAGPGRLPDPWAIPEILRRDYRARASRLLHVAHSHTHDREAT
jgi:hypothetical protein